MMTINLAPVGE